MPATVKSLPAPVGGWNARDSIAAMPPTDAVSLTNWFPTTTECQLRKGYTNWATGLPGQVETVMAYAGGAVDKLFGVSAGSIYDCTTNGAVGAAAVAGLANSRLQYINNATAGGNYLMAVNGADKLRYFDGTTWSADGGTFTITVANTANWSQILLHKQRVWGIVKNTLTAYYLAPGAIAGAASLFDMSPFFKHGGFIVAAGGWTVSSVQGPNEHLAFITNKGEVLVYAGSDPSSITTWTMQGLFRIGAPIGDRPLVKFSADLLIITQDGVEPISKALDTQRTSAQAAITDKIQWAVSDVINSYQTNFGWQLMDFPQGNFLIVNVPIATGSQQQYVMNTITGAWCNFTGWSANCWELYKNNAYFGGNTVVCLAWNTNADNGMNITANALQAYNYFGSRTLKRFTMSRPIFRASGQPAIFAGYSIDFDTTDNTTALAYASSAAVGTWGSGQWGTATWGATSLNVIKGWQGANGVGYAAAPRVKTTSQGFDLRWVSTDVVFERGAFI